LLILTNGKVWTGDGFAESVVIEGNRIAAVGGLTCYTANNAYAMWREREIGRIAPGMLADLVVLSDDLFTIAPARIPAVKVDFTIFDGKTIYERRN